MSLLNINDLNTEFINARVIVIKCPISVEVTYDSDYFISSVRTKKYEISVGNELEHNFENIPSKFKVLSIKELEMSKDGYRRFGLVCGVHNKVEQYLLPTLYVKNKFTPSTMMLDVYYLGSFISLEEKMLVVCYRYSRADLYRELESFLKTHPRFVKVNSVNTIDYYYFKINWDDVSNFIDGNYSKLSNNLKLNIINFYKLGRKDFITKVLYKDPTLKKEIESRLDILLDDTLELDSKPDTMNFIIGDSLPVF